MTPRPKPRWTSCRCLRRGQCNAGAALVAAEAKAFAGYIDADTFEARGAWLTAKRAMGKHVAKAFEDRVKAMRMRGRLPAEKRAA